MKYIACSLLLYIVKFLFHTCIHIFCFVLPHKSFCIIRLHIYIYMCVCVSVCLYMPAPPLPWTNLSHEILKNSTNSKTHDIPRCKTFRFGISGFRSFKT